MLTSFSSTTLLTVDSNRDVTVRCVYKPAFFYFCIVLIATFVPFLTGWLGWCCSEQMHHQDWIIPKVNRIQVFRRPEGQQPHFMLLTFAIYSAAPGLNEKKEMKDQVNYQRLFTPLPSLRNEHTKAMNVCFIDAKEQWGRVGVAVIGWREHIPLRGLEDDSGS